MAPKPAQTSREPLTVPPQVRFRTSVFRAGAKRSGERAGFSLTVGARERGGVWSPGLRAFASTGLPDGRGSSGFPRVCFVLSASSVFSRHLCVPLLLSHPSLARRARRGPRGGRAQWQRRARCGRTRNRCRVTGPPRRPSSFSPQLPTFIKVPPPPVRYPSNHRMQRPGPIVGPSGAASKIARAGSNPRPERRPTWPQWFPRRART